MDRSERPGAERFHREPWRTLWDSVWGRYWRWVRAEEVASELGLPQRVSYQRTVVSVQVGIALVIAVVALITSLQSPATVVIPRHHAILPRDLHILDESEKVEGPYPAARSNVPPEERRGGFLGFVNLTPRDDRKAPELPAPVLSNIYSRAPEPLFDRDRAVSFSLEEGLIDTVVLPEGVDNQGFQPRSTIERLNRPPCVVKKFDPPYPSAYLMSDSLLEGLVALEVAVDERGNMVRFVPVLPDGKSLDTAWYFMRAELIRHVVINSNGFRKYGPWRPDSATLFAENVIWMLKFWTFGPALADGCPVSGEMNITYHFCLDYPDCDELTLEDVVMDVAYNLPKEE